MKLNPVEKAMIQEMYTDHKEMKSTLLETSIGVKSIVGRVEKVEKKTSNHDRVLWLGTGFIAAIQFFKSLLGHG